MSDYRDDKDHDATMPPPNNAGVSEAPKLHPLLAAFHDMAKVATTQRGLKVLARIEHGIKNREAWIAARESQIARLHALSQHVLEAYDDGDEGRMRQVMIEVEQIVNMSEGVSAAEVRVGEVFDADDENEETGMFPPADRLPFKRRRTSSIK
jgi:hypothetical protein